MTEPTDWTTSLQQALSQPRIQDDARRAAVAIVLRDEGTMHTSHARTRTRTRTRNLPQVLLIQRAPNARDPWSAHIAFPGGRCDDTTDACDLDTAIREAREEIGLDLADSSTYKLLGRLDDRSINGRGNLQVLSAFVFKQVRDATYSLTLQEKEVASAFWVSLAHICKDSPHVCEHALSSSRTAVSNHSILRFADSVIRSLGLTDMRMPAADILPLADDKVVALDTAKVPPVVLWGLTLSCIGDVVTALSMRRIDWPAALPNNHVLGGIVWAACEAWWSFTTALTRLKGVTSRA